MKLNDKQIYISELADGPTIINAGPGTGKTTLLIARMKYLIEVKKVNPSDILCISFTRRAKIEIKERLKKHIKYPGKLNVNVCTFHGLVYSFGSRNSKILKIGLNDFGIIGDYEWSMLIKKITFETDLPISESWASNDLKKIKKYILLKKMDSINRFVKEKKINFLFSQPEVNRSLAYVENYLIRQIFETRERLEDFWQTYKKIKNSISQFTLHEIVADYSKASFEWMYENETDKFPQTYKYVFIDEFQDTNLIQYNFAKQITEKDASGNQNLWVVGDINQCIYSFSGADINMFNIFKNEFEDNPKFSIQKLNTVYRFGNKILNLANQIIVENKTDEDLVNDLKVFNYSSKDETPKLFVNKTDDQIIEKVMSLIDQGVEPKEIGILSRENINLAHLSKKMKSKKIPHIFESDMARSFFKLLSQNALINKIFHFFKLIGINKLDKNIFDVVSEFANNFEVDEKQPHLSKKSLEILNNGYKHEKEKFNAMGFLEFVFNLEISEKYMGNDTSIYKFFQIVHHLREDFFEELREFKWINRLPMIDLINEKIKKLTDRLIEDSFFESDSIKLNEGTINSLAIFISSEWRKMPELSFLNVINNLFKSYFKNKKDVIENKIRLMSIHKSKGTEFDYVILITPEKDVVFNLRKKIEVLSDDDEYMAEDMEKEIEEERRVYYVACTRAKKQIFIFPNKMLTFLQAWNDYYEVVQDAQKSEYDE